MNGFGVFMIIFGVCLFFPGLYVFLGHNNELLLWRGYSKNRTKHELKIIGGSVMVISFILIIIGILGIIFDFQ